MHSYAQTNIQLFNQLRRVGYSNTDLSLVRDGYELAMVLFTGRFQPSGKSFIAHVVGTASILASLRLPPKLVAAGLIHNVYENGDFGTGRIGISAGKRDEIRKTLGPEVEEYVARFAALCSTSPTADLARNNPDKLASVDRGALLILLAEGLEHLLDCDILYYGDAVTRSCIDNSKIAVEIAEKLGLSVLGAELRKAIREVESADRPVDLSGQAPRSFVIAPKSCRKRLLVTLRQNLIQTTHRFRSKIRRGLSLLYRKSTRLVKAFLQVQKRYSMGLKPKSKPVSECLQTNSEAFRSLFPEDAVLERVATGFQFTEGPVWIAEEKRLLFSDIPANRIYGLAADGRVITFREPSGNSNGLTRDHKGRLVACEHGNRRVTRAEKDGSITPLADRFQAKKLNSPNDVIVKSDGAIYFTDPAYGIAPDQQEQLLEGVYRLCPDGKEISLVADDLARPNGLAFSPDEKRLYIADSERRHIRVYDVQVDGSLSSGSLFHEMNVNAPGVPDGIKVDVEGRVYCTGAAGVWVFDRDGSHLGTILTPEKPSNCAWGGSDSRTLYITACSSVYAIRTRTPGILPYKAP